MSSTEPRLIFDIGAHTGEDTEFYLEKGFRVVAVEANPEMCSRLESRFSGYIKSNSLNVVQKAIVEQGISEVSIFVNDSVDSWSSIYRDVASRGIHNVREIRVEAITLEDLCSHYGTPYFMKVDIESSDIMVAKSLSNIQTIPTYSSFELHSVDIIHESRKAGYSKFQIRNQMLNGLLAEPKSTQEGKKFWPASMDGYHSGIFGRDLPPNDWVSYGEIIELYNAYLTVKRFSELKDSWFDLHAYVG